MRSGEGGGEPIRDHGVLAGIRVVELGESVAASVAGMVLADFGADVVKIEQGEWAAEARRDPGFAARNRNKRSLLQASCVAAELTALRDGADVVLVGPRSSDLARFERGHAQVVAELPVYRGPAPWAGGHESSGLLAATNGLAFQQSSVTDAPVDLVYAHTSYVQGLWAAACVVSGLYERHGSGEGCRLTVDGMHATLIASAATYVIDPVVHRTRPHVLGAGGPNPCYTTYRCADDQWIFLGALLPKFQLAALELLELGDLVSDPRLGGDLDRMLLPEHHAWLHSEIAARFATRPRDEWLQLLVEVGCPTGPVLGRDEWLDDPHITDNDGRVEVVDDERGPVVMPGVPLVLTRSPGTVRSGAPGAGSSSAPGWRAASRVADAKAAATSGLRVRPLDGVRVLDLGTVLAGPLTGSLLTRLGADVVKVEPLEGDGFRAHGISNNRGMRSLAVDLRSADGARAFQTLVARSDVVIDNYRAGVLQRLGIDHDHLAEVNPDIISFSITGFGHGGPSAEKPGFDPVLQAMSGMMTAQGGRAEPVFITTAINDVTSAVVAALGTCLALFHRDAGGGGGQRAWTSLAVISAFLQCAELTRYAGRPAAPEGGRDHRGPGPLDRYYETGDGWIRLQATRADVPTLCEALRIEVPGMASGATTAELEPYLEEALQTRGTEWATAVLTSVGIPAVAARRPVDLLDDEHLMRTGMFHRYHLADGEPYFAPGAWVEFDRFEHTRRLIAPGIGEHTGEILCEVGYSEGDIAELVSRKAVSCGAPMSLAQISKYR